MSLVFASPLMLLGLITGVIPILIHRLTHQKTIKKPFSAVRLLIRSQKVVARPQRLKHLLLLALRVAAIALVMLMAARPSLVRPGLLAFGTGGAKVIIVDNSMSMGYRDADGERFRQALAAAGTIVGHLSDLVAVIPTVAPSDLTDGGGEVLLKTPKEAAKDLSLLTLSSGKGDPGDALAKAFKTLKTTTGRKEIVVMSDMARGDWQGLDPTRLGTAPADGRITALRIGGNGRDSNTAIKDVKAGSGAIFSGSPFPLEVMVGNLSDKDSRVVAKLLVDGVGVDQKSLQLNAGEEGKAVFEFVSNRSGWANGEVQLSADNLPADNVFYFPLFVRAKQRIALVDGDPRPAMRGSESYYLARALLPDDSGRSPFQVQVMYEREFQEKDLSAYDALFLLNVRQPAPAKIGGFLGGGKNVFIFLGDRVLPDEYNSIPLFPWRLRGPREFGQKPEKISRIDYDHKALAQFHETGGASLSGASFSKSYKVEGGSKPLLTLGNGDPLLLESPSGRGRLYLYTSSADLDWNDLPLAASYVPLLQGLVKTALRASESPIPPGIRVGEAFEEKSTAVQMAGQQGGAGVYRLSVPAGEVRRAMNVPFDESDLTKMTEQDLKRLFPGIAVTVTEYRQNGGEALYGSRYDLWPYLLGMALLVLAVEMGVAHRI